MPGLPQMPRKDSARLRQGPVSSSTAPLSRPTVTQTTTNDSYDQLPSYLLQTSQREETPPQPSGIDDIRSHSPELHRLSFGQETSQGPSRPHRSPMWWTPEIIWMFISIVAIIGIVMSRRRLLDTSDLVQLDSYRCGLGFGQRKASPTMAPGCYSQYVHRLFYFPLEDGVHDTCR